MIRRLLLGMAATLVVSIGQPVAAGTVTVLDQEVSVGLSYVMGWGDVVLRDSGTAVSDGLRPVFLRVGGESEVEQYRTFGQQRVQTENTASGSMAYTLLPGMAPSFFATLQTSLSVAASGTLAVAQAQASLLENYAFYEFEVTGGEIEYSLSFSESVDWSRGLLRLRDDNSVFVSLAASGDRTGTLMPGRYRVRAFYALSANAAGNGDASGDIQFAMTFPGATLQPIPLPGTGLALASGLVVLAARGCRRSPRRD